MSPTPQRVESPRQSPMATPMEDDTNSVNQTVLIQNNSSFPPDFGSNNFSNFANGVPYGALPPPHPTTTSEGSQAQGSLRTLTAGGSEGYPRSFLAQGVPILIFLLRGCRIVCRKAHRMVYHPPLRAIMLKDTSAPHACQLLRYPSFLGLLQEQLMLQLINHRPQLGARQRV